MNKIILIFLLSLSAFSNVYNLRKCTMLPITDTVNNKLAVDVYKSLEAGLKTSKWCDYNSSSELMAVFNKYRNKLREHLNDPSVIKAVSKKLRTGSIIRINLNYEVNTVEVIMEVVGETGEDIYFKEKFVIDNRDADKIVFTIRNWLQTYSEIIPYDGKIYGVLGNQITFSKVEKQKLSIGQKFQIRRFSRKRKHPLLKKIVDWESVEVGSGKVVNSNAGQAIGQVLEYSNNLKARTDDWIIYENEIIDYGSKDNFYKKTPKSQKFGRLGEALVTFDLASSTVSNSVSGSNKVNGFTYGIGVDVEAWINREYFVIGELSRRIGNLKEESGDLDTDKPSTTNGLFSVGGGYKYLPLGFFYGPQVNIFGGYNYYTYNLQKSKEDGLGSATISGLFLGVGGNMPINKEFRIYGKARMTPFAEFEDGDNVYGTAKKISSFHIKGGARYTYSPIITLDGGFEMITNSVDFSRGGTSSIDYKESMLRVGVSFIF